MILRNANRIEDLRGFDRVFLDVNTADNQHFAISELRRHGLLKRGEGLFAEAKKTYLAAGGPQVLGVNVEL